MPLLDYEDEVRSPISAKHSKQRVQRIEGVAKKILLSVIIIMIMATMAAITLSS